MFSDLAVLLPSLAQLVVLHSAQQPILELAHPWPEWVQLMKCLLYKGYFCREEGKMLCNAGMGMKDFDVIRTVCLNFGRDHFHLLRRFLR
ncbi:hypothetical protein AAZX31_10G119000 [Glycine max]|uniref:Uncharacterized protein n=1 Tax=Glycine max TaxID=3847 RepID=K7LJ49_SOYBN|nr:hypothetical protein GLYMA_10G130300v4 [Glycine max]KAG4397362.1 hypothetical protein GLYMA_10G130300v4 [Glycine max]KAG4397363.1 hypothetical protein GLYMA_10G130300v4 [Glycine max]KAH1138016.1 hypothetical protein GYH30_027855 [Glycine max]KAH1138017.1 hypothetical protein GYH30_027855 [Glycine max]